MAMTLVSTVTVGSGGAASIQFDNIPQSGKDLLLLFSGRVDYAGSGARDYNLHINNETTGTNYTSRTLMGFGSTVASYNETSARFPMEIADNGFTALTFSSVQIYLSNYTSSVAKSVSIDLVTENNGTNNRISIDAGRWNNTAAITSLTLRDRTYNTAQYSSASLYIIS
jgi:hypothetical protein